MLSQEIPQGKEERNNFLQMYLHKEFLIPVFLQLTSFSSQTLPIWHEIFVNKQHKPAKKLMNKPLLLWWK